MQVNGSHLQKTLLKKACAGPKLVFPLLIGSQRHSRVPHQVAKATAVLLEKCKGVSGVTLLSGCSCRASSVTLVVMSFSARLMTDSEEWQRRSKAAM